MLSSNIKLLSGRITTIEFCEAFIISYSHAIKILILDKSGCLYISSSNIGSKRFSKKSLLKYLRFTKFEFSIIKKYTLETLKDTLKGWAILESIYY